MSINKISFAYVTVAQPGMIANSQSYIPQMVMRNADPEMSHLLVVTVGLLFSSSEPYAIDAEVLFDGESIIDPAYSSDDKMDVPLFTEPEPGQIVTMAHLRINGVRFKKSGIYQVRCCLAEDMDKLRSSEYVDIKDSFFYVSIGKNEVETH